MEFHLFDPSRSSVVRFTSYAAMSEQQRMKYRNEQNYDIVPFEIKQIPVFFQYRYTVHP